MTSNLRIDVDEIRRRCSQGITEIVSSPQEYYRVQQILRDREALLAEVDRLAQVVADKESDCARLHNAFMDAKYPETKRVETPVNAVGSKLMMELFNLMPIKALAEVPADIAERISNFMVENGYRMVFDRWYIQAEPREPARPDQTTIPAHADPTGTTREPPHCPTCACSLAPDRPADSASARPLSEYHEDHGNVVWWKFPVNEPSWIGQPSDDSWPGYHTHWTPHPPVPTGVKTTTEGG